MNKIVTHTLPLLLLFIIAAELISRFDDWLHGNVPFFSTPDRERDLTIVEDNIIRGRPRGSFRKWKLDNYGFRGPDISIIPEAEITRVMILGASEMFGLYESPGKEVAAQLQQMTSSNKKFEIINGSIAAVSLKRLTDYWNHWTYQFKPHYVLIYPAPMFYLDQEVPGRKEIGPPQETNFIQRSRFINRLIDIYHRMPAFIKAWREEWTIRSLTKGKDESWFFKTVPEDRVQAFSLDLEELIEAIKVKGTTPVLMTHGSKGKDPQAMRMSFPRPTTETILAFETRANEVIKELGAKKNIEVIDVASVVNEKQEFFADFVHYTDAGATVVATIISNWLTHKITN